MHSHISLITHFASHLLHFGNYHVSLLPETFLYAKIIAGSVAAGIGIA